MSGSKSNANLNSHHLDPDLHYIRDIEVSDDQTDLTLDNYGCATLTIAMKNSRQKATKYSLDDAIDAFSAFGLCTMLDHFFAKKAKDNDPDEAALCELIRQLTSVTKALINKRHEEEQQ